MPPHLHRTAFGAVQVSAFRQVMIPELQTLARTPHPFAEGSWIPGDLTGFGDL